jgi:hypothetical protein
VLKIDEKAEIRIIIGKKKGGLNPLAPPLYLTLN